MIAHLLVSGVAAAALVGFWIANPLESTAETVSETGDAEPQELRTTPVAEVKVALASVDIRDTAIPEAAAAEVLPPVEALPVEVPLVEVPDVQKLSVWEARKQLKKQGLRFSFKRGSRRVHHEDFDFYRVRKQSLPAGERVATGTKVIVQVREIRYASGY
jgi:hypothetical protein